jgi:stress response protein YsnF
LREEDVEMHERAEVPVVNKEARVVEEIRVSKDVEEREETVRDTVRSTDVDVENLSGNNLRNSSSTTGTTGLTGSTGTTNRDTDYDETNRNTRID